MSTHAERHVMMHKLDGEAVAMLEHLTECVEPAMRLGMRKELDSVKRSLDRFHKRLRVLHREAVSS